MIPDENNDRPSITLLHGWGFRPSVFEPVVSYFEETYSVHAPDLFDWTPVSADHNEYLDAIVSRLAATIRSATHLVGWSFGGIVALRLADRFPEKVSALTLANSIPLFAMRDGWPFGFSPEELVTFRKFLDRKVGFAVRALISRAASCEREPAPAKNVMSAHAHNEDLAVLRVAFEVLAAVDVRAEFGRISVPFGGILGSRDLIVGDASMLLPVLRDMNAGFDGRVIANAGHAPFITEPSEFWNVFCDLGP